MRIHRPRPAPPAIPTIPFVSLAFLVGTMIIVTGMYSTSRGPGLRFASPDRDGSPPEGGSVRVEVTSEQEARVDGEAVPFDSLANSVAAKTAGRGHPTVMLFISPEASYETLVVAYGAIAGLPSQPRIILPSAAREQRG